MNLGENARVLDDVRNAYKSYDELFSELKAAETEEKTKAVLAALNTKKSAESLVREGNLDTMESVFREEIEKFAQKYGAKAEATNVMDVYGHACEVPQDLASNYSFMLDLRGLTYMGLTVNMKKEAEKTEETVRTM